MFDWLYSIFGTILAFFNDLTGHYALALVLYALVFKIVFLPFSIKTQKNQIAMAKLRPRIAKIEKKYAGRNDRATLQKKQQEIMELQQQEGYNPLSGCLPLLLQLPLIIFLYNVIRNPLSYICKWSSETITAVLAKTGGTATDQIGAVSAIKDFVERSPENLAEIETIIKGTLDLPNFELFGVNLANTPAFANFNLLLLIPFLAAGFQWLSMWLTRKWMGNQPMGGDAQSQMSLRIMDLVMPLMTIWFTFEFSAMLGLYWIYQSIFAIAQQFILCKAMPLPKYTEAQIREMEKMERERAKAQRSAIQSQPKVKSLHYIDDEDYDSLPEIKPSTEKKGTMGLSSSEIKDDDNTKK